MSSKPPVQARATRRFTVPPERVFDAWLDPSLVRRWFGPGLGQLTQVELEPRVGGSFLFVQRRGEVDAAHGGVYLELDRPRRLVFTWHVPPGSTDASRVTIVIAAHAQGCELRLTHAMDPAWTDYKERVESAWSKMLAAMAVALRSRPAESSG